MYAYLFRKRLTMKKSFVALLALASFLTFGTPAQAAVDPLISDGYNYEEINKIGGFAMNIAHTGVDANEDNVVSQLELQIGSLSTDELRYIVSNSVLPKVKAAAASAIVN